MKTLKLFIKLLIVFLLLYIFVDFMSFAYVASTYKELKEYTIEENELEIAVAESKASKVRGYVKGIVENKTEKDIDTIYLGVDCFSKYNNSLETTYIKIDSLKKSEAREFTLPYQAEEVKSIKIYDTRQVPQIAKIEKQKIDGLTVAIITFTTLFCIYHIPWIP